MHISPVSNNFSRANYTNKMNVNRQNFKGLLNDYEEKRVLKMLKPAVSETITCEKCEDLIEIINRMKNKSVNNSIGIIPIMGTERDYCFKDMLSGEQVSNYNNCCVCVATGDKIGPMEVWNTVHDAVLVVVPTSEMAKTRIFHPL